MGNKASNLRDRLKRIQEQKSCGALLISDQEVLERGCPRRIKTTEDTEKHGGFDKKTLLSPCTPWLNSYFPDTAWETCGYKVLKRNVRLSLSENTKVNSKKKLPF